MLPVNSLLIAAAMEQVWYPVRFGAYLNAKIGRHLEIEIA